MERRDCRMSSTRKSFLRTFAGTVAIVASSELLVSLMSVVKYCCSALALVCGRLWCSCWWVSDAFPDGGGPVR
jgi:hypothetical protein